MYIFLNVLLVIIKVGSHTVLLCLCAGCINYYPFNNSHSPLHIVIA